MSRISTPPPVRVTRAGTFDRMEKSFFDSASAIEAGEVTAPPEVTSGPATLFKGWWVQLQNLALYQKIALGAAAAVLIAGAVLVFSGKPAAHVPAAPPETVTAPAPTPANPASSAAVVEPAKIQKKHSATLKRRAHTTKRPLARSKPSATPTKRTRR